MESFEHKSSRAFHRYRHGYSHLQQHRRGERHKHKRRNRRHRAAAAPTRRLPPVALGAIIAGAVVIIAMFFVVASAYRALQSARGDLTTAELSVSSVSHDPSVLTSKAGRANLAAALNTIDSQASSARSTVDGSWALSILHFVPIVGRQVDGTRSLVDDLHTTSSQATLLLDKLTTLTSDSTATSINLVDLAALRDQVDQSVSILSALPTSTSGLWGPIKQAQGKFNGDIHRVTSLLSTGQSALTYALPLLGADGPKSYFLAAENNAEMRDQGAVLSWALVNTNNGSYSVNSPASVDTQPLYSPAPYPLPPGTEEVFGPLEPTRLWQSTNATADFPLSGAVMSAMYTKASHGGHVDGVIALDVIGLKDLLALTGPVDVPSINKVVTATNIVPLTLNTLYRSYPASDPQASRHDVLSTIAKAVVDRLKHSSVDVAALVKTLAKATQGRHLLVWDSNPTYQTTVTKFGASGSLSATAPNETFHLAVESAVAAKLDYYIRTSVSYQVSVAANGDAYVSTAVTIHNTAPRNAKGSYIFGPDHVNSTFPGEYVSRVYLWSPITSIVAGGIPESGLIVNPTSTVVGPQSSSEVDFQTVIPHAVKNGHFAIRLIPQSSLTPQVTTVNVTGPNVAVTAQRSFPLVKPTTLRFSVATP